MEGRRRGLGGGGVRGRRCGREMRRGLAPQPRTVFGHDATQSDDRPFSAAWGPHSIGL